MSEPKINWISKYSIDNSVLFKNAGLRMLQSGVIDRSDPRAKLIPALRSHHVPTSSEEVTKVLLQYAPAIMPAEVRPTMQVMGKYLRDNGYNAKSASFLSRSFENAVLRAEESISLSDFEKETYQNSFMKEALKFSDSIHLAQIVPRKPDLASQYSADMGIPTTDVVVSMFRQNMIGVSDPRVGAIFDDYVDEFNAMPRTEFYKTTLKASSDTAKALLRRVNFIPGVHKDVDSSIIALGAIPYAGRDLKDPQLIEIAVLRATAKAMEYSALALNKHAPDHAKMVAGLSISSSTRADLIQENVLSKTSSLAQQAPQTLRQDVR